MNNTRREWLSQSLGIGAATCLSATAVLAQPAPKESPLPRLGTALALPQADLLGGGRFVPSQADGKLTVIYWWASWCPFCMVQSPHIEALWKAHQAKGLQMLTLSIDKTEQAALDYLKKKNYSFPAAMYTPAIAKALPKPKGLPVVVVRGKDGKVRHAESGEMFPEDIEKIGQWV